MKVDKIKNEKIKKIINSISGLHEKIEKLDFELVRWCTYKMTGELTNTGIVLMYLILMATRIENIKKPFIVYKKNGDKTIKCFFYSISVRKLGRILDINKTTIDECLKRLEKEGIIYHEYVQGRHIHTAKRFAFTPRGVSMFLKPIFEFLKLKKETDVRKDKPTNQNNYINKSCSDNKLFKKYNYTITAESIKMLFNECKLFEGFKITKARARFIHYAANQFEGDSYNKLSCLRQYLKTQLEKLGRNIENIPLYRLFHMLFCKKSIFTYKSNLLSEIIRYETFTSDNSFVSLETNKVKNNPENSIELRDCYPKSIGDLLKNLTLHKILVS